MADKLTPQQSQAVFDRGGSLLVSAAAGSGKTKVLVDRLLTYLTDPTDPANLDEFLIITYTKAAASELRGKIAAKLTERIAAEPENRHLQNQMQRLYLTKISTVHGFCSDLLREYAYRLDLAADFRVAEESECRELRELVLADLLDRAYTEFAEDPDFRGFADSQGLGRDDRMVPEIIEKVYDSARCHLDPQKWLEECLDSADTGTVSDVSETVWGRSLMKDLFSYLEKQIRIFRNGAEELQVYPEMEKAVRNLKDALYQLEKLAEAQTWDEIVENRRIDFGRLTFPKKNPDPEASERIKAARNACKKGLEKKLRSFSDRSGQLLADMGQTNAATRGLIMLVREFENGYREAKRSRRCLDFSDLEHKALDLLLGKGRSNLTAAAKEIGGRFREVMVDEYQDSNGVQDAIFMALTQERSNCFLVGDVKQSIYQFRLADPNIFLEKYNRFQPSGEAGPGQGRKVMLSHNFRSGPEVIEAVNDVFRVCMSPEVGGLYYGSAEALREGVPHEPLPDPAVSFYAVDVQESTYEEEAAFVAEEIRTMLRSGTRIRRDGTWKAVEPKDIVILLRSPGSSGIYFQRALEARGIRCTTGGGTDLLKTEEIGTLRAFLQTIMNPRQDIPLISTLASPVFGFTADDLASVRGNCKKGSVYDALVQSDLPKADQFLRLLEELRYDSRTRTLSALIERCFALTRMDSIYAAMPGGDARSMNLQIFLQYAVEYEKGNQTDLLRFLTHLDTLEQKGLVTANPAGSDCVTIMSIHKSKGLEFPVVFLCNLSRKFNMEDLRGQILCDKELGLGLSVADPVNRIRYPSLAKRAISAKMAAQSVSEELRVLYVAMTRARDRLIMTYASRTLEADLTDVALRMDFDGGSLLSADAICLGDWVLLAAMGKTEAGALHSVGGRPSETVSGAYPWKIRIVQAPERESALPVTQVLEGMPHSAEEILRSSIAFRYPHLAATQTPSKQTATGLKGRVKDSEAAEGTGEQKTVFRSWRKPSFLARKTEGKTVGNSIHLAMQYLRYEHCASAEEVAREVASMVDRGLLTAEQAGFVDCGQIADFFATDIGKKLRSGQKHIREFKFSILEDAGKYAEGLDGETVLLQGVVDCALLEEDGITVLDFKTDYVTEETVAERTHRYCAQVQAYAQAISRIYELPVKGAYLYFFRLGRFIQV